VDFLVETQGGIRATSRERSLVDCLASLEYSGGIEELDLCLAAFPSFDFDAAFEYLRLLQRPWLYSRLGYMLDRHADRSPAAPS
jgi:predicted transcriptional regulator of viral defense system